MADTKSLKDENKALLRGYLFLQIAALAVALSLWPLESLTIDNLKENYLTIIWSSSLSAIALSIGTISLSGLFSRETKARLIFWKRSNPMPGSRAFSVHANNDARIDVTSLEEKYGPLPSDEGSQNRLWYQLYKGLRSEPTVRQAHKSFLLTRELMTYTVFLGPIGVVIVLWQIGGSKILTYFAISQIILFLIFVFSARRYAIDLVQNVLAEASEYKIEIETPDQPTEELDSQQEEPGNGNARVTRL